MGREHISGVECDYYVHSEFDTSVHMYFSTVDGTPVKLIEELIEDGVSTHLLTFEYSNAETGPVEDEVFELPNGYVHDGCQRHIGGFPYLHIFHYFVRF